MAEPHWTHVIADIAESSDKYKRRRDWIGLRCSIQNECSGEAHPDVPAGYRRMYLWVEGRMEKNSIPIHGVKLEPITTLPANAIVQDDGWNDEEE